MTIWSTDDGVMDGRNEGYDTQSQEVTPHDAEIIKPRRVRQGSWSHTAISNGHPLQAPPGKGRLLLPCLLSCRHVFLGSCCFITPVSRLGGGPDGRWCQRLPRSQQSMRASLWPLPWFYLSQPCGMGWWPQVKQFGRMGDKVRVCCRVLETLLHRVVSCSVTPASVRVTVREALSNCLCFNRAQVITLYCDPCFCKGSQWEKH